MKLLYLHQYFNTPQMSGGTRSYEMARRLVAAGHEVHIVTSDRSPQDDGDWYVTREAGIVVHWLPVPYANAMSYRERVDAFVRFAWRAAQRAATIPAEVVFATSTPLTIALPAVYAARRQKIPMVFEVRDLWPELPIAIGALKGPVVLPALWLERFAYHQAAQLVALSPGMRDGILRQGVASERVHVIPNSADIDLFAAPEEAGYAFRSRYQWLQDRPLIVYTGTLGRINGVGYLAEIAGWMAQVAPEVRFLVVGGGYEEEAVLAKARELGVLDTSFFMLPSVPKNEIPAILSAATVAMSLFIDLPAMWSNSANKFFDALAAGRPVAINYGGWQADLLEQTGAGIVLPPNDARLAAQQLWALLQAKDRLAHARVAARHLAEQRFDRDKLARQLEEVLKLALVTR
ncbi:glycosyltransferase family 4 protein [Candidatus Chloroploca sp. Khr17]|uniref:glycosyltransferase family 4 protein n=1 Tax=Candidatus Chloroploca sp. Khr17 TaxID=2496869 RepID=UPI00101D866B|nr:glycosyltransferase family 4 protein [Candidatus Chloroploca sp. Khr17]